MLRVWRQETAGNVEHYTERLVAFLNRPTSHIFHLCHALTQVLHATVEKHSDFGYINTASEGRLRFVICY